MHPLPPPAMPPPGFPHPLAPPPGPPPGQEGRTTISAASTVIKMPRAQDDRTVTAMVPASVRLRRDAAPSAPARIAPQHLQQPKAVPEVGPGFGLAPQSAAAAAGGAGYAGTAMDKKYEDFLAEMEGLGALED
ncbi:hypothetical protein WJX74_001016 [Apatococcus lobatus]|uniref:Uncharacterized protein n=1 Tax=Apatococcus lobatus TaxID=904363 RepID=A0AAW1Q1E3_9CHLO